MAAKYADEIAARFSKGDDDSSADSPDEPEPDSTGDAEKGRRFMRAYKSGDAIAIVEALRAICG